jgi:hypothetical protein
MELFLNVFCQFRADSKYHGLEQMFGSHSSRSWGFQEQHAKKFISWIIDSWLLTQLYLHLTEERAVCFFFFFCLF